MCLQQHGFGTLELAGTNTYTGATVVSTGTLLIAAAITGGDVSVESLVEKGAVRGGQLVKVLGTGEIDVAVNVTADAFSASAKQKIEAAGGSATTA